MLRSWIWSLFMLVIITSPLYSDGALQASDNDPAYEGRRVSEWVQMLGSADPGRQSRAASTLVVVGAPAVPQLIAGLKGKSERIRIAAANTLSQMLPTPKSVLPALLEALSDPNEEVRHAAGLAICQLVSLNSSGDEANNAAVPALTKALKHKDPRVCKLVSCALARIQRDKASPDIVNGLIEAVKDKQIEVQEHALDGLESVGLAAKSALPTLQDLLKQKTDPDIRFKAVLATAAIDPKSKATIDLLIKALPENNPNARKRLGDKSGMYYSMAAKKLGQIGPPAKDAIKPLGRTLLDSDGNVRVYAALALSRIAPEKAKEMVHVLIELLKHQDSLVRVNAVAALHEIGPTAREAVGPLRDLIRMEKESFVREGAVEALKVIAPDEKE